MYKVIIGYQVIFGSDAGSFPYYTDWFINLGDKDEAIRRAMVDTTLMAAHKYNISPACVRILSHDVLEMTECSSCGGTGKRASMEGHYTCPTCKGTKYLS